MIKLNNITLKHVGDHVKEVENTFEAITFIHIFKAEWGSISIVKGSIPISNNLNGNRRSVGVVWADPGLALVRTNRTL